MATATSVQYSIAALVSEGGGDRGFASCLDALLRLVFGHGQGRKRAEAGSAESKAEIKNHQRCIFEKIPCKKKG